MTDSHKLHTKWDVSQQGEINTDKNYQKMYQVFNLEVLRKYIRNKPVICIGAGPSLDEILEDIKKIQDKAYIFTCLQSYEKLLQEEIIPDCVFSIETQNIMKIDPDLYKRWESVCQLNPPKYFITPSNVATEIFNLPAENHLGYYTINYPNAITYAYKNYENLLWGGRSVGTHMHQIALKFFAQAILTGYDYCWYEEDKQRASNAYGHIDIRSIKKVKTWTGEGYTTESYMGAAKDQEKVMGLNTLYQRNTLWCSPGLKLKGVRRYTPFKQVATKIDLLQPVDDLPSLQYKDQSVVN